MRTSGQVRVDKYCPWVAEEEIDCSTQTTVLWRQNDGEGKFVSFKVVLGGTSLFKMYHGPAGLDCLVCRFYWSTGAAEGLIMVDSGACLRGEIPRKVFFVWTCVIAFVGKTLTLTEKKELEVLPSLDHSLTHVRSLCRWVRSHWSEERERERERERGRANSKKRQKRSAQVDVLCSFFCCTARRSPVN